MARYVMRHGRGEGRLPVSAHRNREEKRGNQVHPPPVGFILFCCNRKRSGGIRVQVLQWDYRRERRTRYSRIGAIRAAGCAPGFRTRLSCSLLAGPYRLRERRPVARILFLRPRAFRFSS